MHEIKHIVFATDLAESSQLALDTVRFLWPKLEGTLTLLHVVPDTGFGNPPPSEEEEAQILNEKRDALEGIATELGGEARAVLLRGDPSRTITNYVNESADVDVLVLGRHYYSRLQKLLTGVVADTVVKEVTCPVLRC